MLRICVQLESCGLQNYDSMEIHSVKQPKNPNIRPCRLSLPLNSPSFMGRSATLTERAHHKEL